MATFQTGRESPASRKLVFSQLTLRKWFFGWTESGSLFFQDTQQEVTAVNENGAAMESQVSLVALNAYDPAAVGGFFWDQDAALLYVKPITGTTAFENFYVASLEVIVSTEGSAYNGTLRKAKILSKPGQNIKTSNLFDGKLARIATGTIALENTGGFATVPDFEPDGSAALIASFEIY